MRTYPAAICGVLRSVATSHNAFYVYSGRELPRSAAAFPEATAGRANSVYGVFEVGVNMPAGQTTVLNYTIWMTPLDTAHAVRVPFPTASEVVVTTPLLPGLEFRIPANTTITDIDGKVASEISITPISIQQPPFPLPAGVR